MTSVLINKVGLVSTRGEYVKAGVTQGKELPEVKTRPQKTNIALP